MPNYSIARVSIDRKIGTIIIKPHSFNSKLHMSHYYSFLQTCISCHPSHFHSKTTNITPQHKAFTALTSPTSCKRTQNSNNHHHMIPHNHIHSVSYIYMNYLLIKTYILPIIYRVFWPFTRKNLYRYCRWYFQLTHANY